MSANSNTPETAYVASETVYTGIWTNWSYGKVSGSTLTLTQQDSNLLIAFVAFFITVVSVEVWKLACFAIHSYLSTPERCDVIHHQRQAIFRNTRAPGSAMFVLLHLAWTWRASKPYKQILPFLGITILAAAMLSLATGFSARLARDDHEVVLLGDKCGLPITPTNNRDYMGQFSPWLAQLATSDLNYATQCYSSDSTTVDGCNTFVKQKLQLIATPNTPCPFGDLCKGTNTSILLDTGMVDSHADLGINAPENERFSTRMLWHCAPLETEGHTSTINVSENRSYTSYNYSAGPGNTISSSYQASDNIQADYLQSIETSVIYKTPDPDYSLGTVRAIRFNGSYHPGLSTLSPIKELSSETADTHLIFLSANAVPFQEKVFDPWYHATKPFVDLYTARGDDRVEMFAQDQPASPLACLVQTQYCGPGLTEANRCTPLSGQFISPADVSDYLKVQEDSRALDWLLTFIFMNPNGVLDQLGTQALVSRKNMGGGTQGALPDNQWEIEATSWFSIALSDMQRTWVDMAMGHYPHLSEAYIRRPTSSGEDQLCRSQKIKSTNYVSFSVLGLSLVLGLGLLIMILSYSIESIIRRIQRRSQKCSYSLAEWTTNGFLQLQRLALEEIGLGQWSGCDKSIPYTDEKTEIEPLDLSDPKHPTLHLPPKEQSQCVATTTESTADNGSTTNTGRNFDELRRSSDLVQSATNDLIPSPTNLDESGQTSSAVGALGDHRSLRDTENHIVSADDDEDLRWDQVSGNDENVEQPAIHLPRATESGA